jgi:hypothetical protein
MQIKRDCELNGIICHIIIFPLLCEKNKLVLLSTINVHVDIIIYSVLVYSKIIVSINLGTLDTGKNWLVWGHMTFNTYKSNNLCFEGLNIHYH